jgi:tetratricopeptide (TPR) repeat protein/serine/threonine protein kinase
METVIIGTTTDDQIRNEVERERQAEQKSSGGLLQAGETVGGYAVQSRLPSSGGEAEIYLCAGTDGQTRVLKYYYTKQPNPEVVEKIKSFSSPDIIKLLEYGEYKGRFYSILEYAAGGSLDEKFSDGRYKYLPVGEEEARQILAEMVNAFDTCHRAGIIHRDIKPGNLFYKNVTAIPDGSLKGDDILIGDFGIASVFEADAGMSKHMTETGAKTEGYAAPELYSGVIGPEMDYYSLGVTLWVLLTGKEPFVNEKGHALFSGQIMLDAIQGKTADKLLSRSPRLSAAMQNLIRGLLTVRHDKRWKLEEVRRFLAGENVEVFNEVRTLPSVEVGGKSCSSYQEIAEALLVNPQEGKKFVFGGKLPAYLIKIDQKLADRLLEEIDEHSAKDREGEGLVYIAYSLCPNMAFPLDHDRKISSMEDMLEVLETDPRALLPFLRDERRGFYAYLKAAGLEEQGKRVKEIVDVTSGNIRAVSRVTAAFRGNVITPFTDGINDEYRLASMKDLEALPGYLKERTLIFIERNCGLLPAWIENMTGRNLDLWLYKTLRQPEQLRKWGGWKCFTLFLEGKDLQINVKFGAGEGTERRYGLKDPLGRELLPAIWEDAAEASRDGEFIVRKNGSYGVIRSGGTTVIPLEYESIEIWDEEAGLYLACKADIERTYSVIAHNGETVYRGPKKLFSLATAENPFAVIFDGGKKILSRDFRVIKEFSGIPVPFVFKDTVYVWEKDGERVRLCDAEGKVLRELPFKEGDLDTVFGAQAVPIREKGKWGGLNPDASPLLPCEFDKAEAGGSYLLLEKDGRGELYLVEDGQARLFWDLEGSVGESLWQKCRELKQKGRIPEMNRLVDVLWKLLYDSEDWENSRRLLFLINRDCMEGLSHTWDYYCFYKGRTCEIQENWEQAAKFYEEVYTLNPRGRDEEGGPYAGYLGVALGQLKDYDRALGCFDTALELIPKNSQIHTAKGFIFHVQGKHNEALACFSLSLECKEDAEVYKSRGDVYNALGMKDQAIADYDQAIRLDPEDAAAYSKRGNVYYSKKDYDRAIADHDQAIRLDPEYAAAYSKRGNVYYSKKDYDRAIADHDQAIRLDPEYAAAYNRRGNVYYSKKDYDRAIADYSQSLRLDPEYAAAYNNRGNVYYSKKDYDRAIADHDQAIRLDPEDAAAYNNRGNAYFNKKDYVRAIVDYDQAIKLNPNNAEYKQNRENAKQKAPSVTPTPAAAPAAPVSGPGPAGNRYSISSISYCENEWVLVMSRSSVNTDRWYTANKHPDDEVKKGWDDGYRITKLAYGNGQWGVVMKKGTKITAQKWTWAKSGSDFPREEIKSLWSNYSITDLVFGINSNGNGYWVVVMSQGTGWTTQSYCGGGHSEFPEDYIKEYWDKDYHITSVAYGNGEWRVVMTKGSGLKNQSYWIRKNYPSKEIDSLWEQGYGITNLEYGNGSWVLVGSTGTGLGQQVVRTNEQFPADEIQKLWNEG